MKIIQYLIVILAVVLFSSCASSGGAFKIKEIDQQPIVKGRIEQANKIAEYKVDALKVDGTYSGTYDRKVANRSIQLAKELAVGNAVSDAKCDFLLGPMYDVDVNGKSITVKVSGYPAHYINFKTLTIADDTTQLVINQQVVLPTSNQAPAQDNAKIEKRQKRRKNLKKAALIYLGTSVVVGLIAAAAGG